MYVVLELGNMLIVLGLMLAAFWFWTLVLPVIAAIVLVGLLTTELGQRRAQAAW